MNSSYRLAPASLARNECEAIDDASDRGMISSAHSVKCEKYAYYSQIATWVTEIPCIRTAQEMCIMKFDRRASAPAKRNPGRFH